MNTVASLRDSLSGRAFPGMARARADATERPISYPLGSGQGEEFALSGGLRPLIRQLLDARSLEAAQARFEAAGFVTGIAPRAYGPTHDGWDDTPGPLLDEARGARRALFVGRDLRRIDDAIAADLAKTDEADRELGRLLGYPRCCVEAFVATPIPRRNTALYAAAARNTAGRANARLNGLDLAVFHYISWSPCAFDCNLSAAYADAVAARIGRWYPAFVRRIDQALSAHRLVLLDEVQISVRGGFDGVRVMIDDAWPTARDRHRDAGLDPDALETVATALALVRSATRGAVYPDGLVLDGSLVPGTSGALLVPFGGLTASGAAGDTRRPP